MTGYDPTLLTYERGGRSVWHQSLRRLLDELFQPGCLGCDDIASGGWRGLLLCPDCRQRLESLTRPFCPCCARPCPVAHGSVCRGARRAPYRRLWAVWSYRPPLDACLRALKFGRLAALASPLGQALGSRIALENPHYDAVVPVPLHWRRRVWRGFDQAVEIARGVAVRLDLPLLRPLARRRATTAQSTLPLPARRVNVSGAFRCRTRVGVEQLRLLVVDDVLTTGATLEAAARELRRHGAAAVDAAVVARTPRPREPSSGGLADPGVRAPL